jgi:hypothetical protein
MGISFSMSAPLAWHLASGELTAQQCEDNEKLLRLIMALEEYPTEHSEELATLDLKLNIVMELLGDLLTHHLELPAEVNLRLGATELRWADDGNLPAAGEQIELSIYPHRSFPRPLILRGRVSDVQADGCHVQLDALPESLQDVFEKFIFAHHRREVAHARHSHP